MVKSSKEKLDLTRKLLQMGLSYRDIQEKLRLQFGSGVSNTTLIKLQKKNDEVSQLRKENDQLREELALFKKLYFELLALTKKRMEKIKNEK
ncbi:hypothetical protein DSAG12_02617 [Promethearchaeum syntrophicum]|uniref:Transposase n=1 Tax=Promethearchaeum syntrophicum TaxID=2594042 RepID=A0A5B9DD34_9ARCH|nr:hypothetical protein [Candidatus Prometheoarchaeum syntrophicum]QEE16787.1 hypothetical protein DSAG12_02617 [Candidatus Prometheoarchaeum syntrophicum]